MNNITLVGRLTKDLELKYGQSGKAYGKFSLAVKRPHSKDEVDFINCVAFGKTAELIDKYLKKGSRVGIVGSLQMSRYEINGEKRTSYEVMVQNIEFLESSKNDTEKENTIEEDDVISSSEFDEEEYFG
jgi:single stranded DNA-binding protein (ssb)